MARRQVYSREFKLGAVARVKAGDQSVAEIAAELGIDRPMLHRWAREFNEQQELAFTRQHKPSPETAELAKLRRQLAQVEMERDILKKVMAAFGGRKP
jgi:transposase